METEDNPSPSSSDTSQLTEKTEVVRQEEEDHQDEVVRQEEEDHQELPSLETGNSSSGSGNKSSPFHGFSSQDEAENDKEEEENKEEVITENDKDDEEDMEEVITGEADENKESSNKGQGQLKKLLIADFGIGPDISEEDGDTENSEDSEGTRVEGKNSVIKNQIISDLGISNEVSEEDDSENCETKDGQDQDDVEMEEESAMETEVTVDTKVVHQENSEELEEDNDVGDIDKDPKDDEIEEKVKDVPDDITDQKITDKKITPLKIGQIKNSPKRVHFSPEVELREQSKEDVFMKSLEVTPKSSKKTTDSSPPLKLKIKFGKDKSGAITHCKINTKASDEAQSEVKMNPLDCDFHGFTEQDIPDWVVDNFEDQDLTCPFDIKPTIFVSISNKKEKQKQPGDSDAVKSLAVPVKAPASEAASVELGGAGASPSPSLSLSKRERRKKSDNLNFVKPLYDGWFREVVWRPVGADKKDADVYYYPPNPPGQKKLRYKTTTELEAFLITSGSMYPISFFTFKKELVGGPPGWEVEREVEALEKPLPVSTVSPLAETLGKRVSKPPEKLIMETETETPTRTSKRMIKPPDKFDTDSFSPASKQPRLDTPEVVKSAPVTPVVQTKQSKHLPVSEQQDKNSGTLKLKNFSKMNVKNQISGVGARAQPENDMMEVEEPEAAAASTPGMTITKVKKSGGSSNQGDTINLPGMPTTGPAPPSYVAVPGQVQPSSISITSLSNSRAGPIMITPGNGCKKILRPGKSTSLPCSIHCPGTSGFPSLSCTSCHCLYHPDCVQVSQASATSNNTEFYCNDCQPPSPNPGNLIPVPPPLHLQRPQPASTAAARTEDSPARPFQGQTMINVAGRKFLVIPHPVIESPPPSPPLSNQKSGGGPAQTNHNPTKNEKMAVVLKPASEDSNLPCFEVEMTPDGKYLLQAKDSAAGSTRNLFSTGTNSWGQHFNMNVNYGYTTVMEVFKYLSVKDRLAAGSVCRMWRDIAVNNSLWRTVSLKNTRIYDWDGFVRFFCQTQSASLDLRKMIFVRERDQTWQDLLAVADRLQSLRKVELPKVPGPVLSDLVTTWHQLETLNVPLVSPPFNIASLATLTHLREVKLKASAGSTISITHRISDLSQLSASLTSLSLLGLEGLKPPDFDVFGTMLSLKSLELGECYAAPENFFKTVSELAKLEKLRLEKGVVGENIGKLCTSHRLKQVELIDFQILPGFRSGLRNLKNIEKFLLIPTYQDKVAEINTEIVEGITMEMRQLTSLYLGVTNEWLEAMAMTSGGTKAGGEKECFPILKSGRLEQISLPALYRNICREMPGCKVKVLKMSAQATCKQYIVNLDQSR